MKAAMWTYKLLFMKKMVNKFDGIWLICEKLCFSEFEDILKFNIFFISCFVVSSAHSTEVVESKKKIKCSFCRAPGHNKKICPTIQAQGWRLRKAKMDTYGPYVESVGKK